MPCQRRSGRNTASSLRTRPQPGIWLLSLISIPQNHKSAYWMPGLARESYQRQLFKSSLMTDIQAISISHAMRRTRSYYPLLEENLTIIKNNANVSFTVNNENYITSQSFGGDTFFKEKENIYDYVIGNPPYLKIPKDAAEAKSMPLVCHGAPNLYFLFWAMGIYNLKQGQELVYIVPRSIPQKSTRCQSPNVQQSKKWVEN